MLEHAAVQKAVIIGGGQVAYHKALNLLRFSISPVIVSPAFHPSFAALADEGKVQLINKKAQWDDVKDAFLTILVTDDEAVNDELAKQLTAFGKLVVHASNPALGNAQIPAVLTRGKLVISISTSGASPSLAKKIRDDLAGQYDSGYEGYIDFLADVRSFVKQHVAERSERRIWLKEAIEPIYLHSEEERRTFITELYSRFSFEECETSR